jgi:antitoxin component of RelBE/YafQ-DinJ toxin-antitoxin module
MTLLQTRVEDSVASRFKQAAEQRAMSPYQLLSELVKQVAGEATKPPGWKEHWERLRTRQRVPLKQNAVVMAREGEDR